jgi:hypothetical protein
LQAILPWKVITAGETTIFFKASLFSFIYCKKRLL